MLTIKDKLLKKNSNILQKLEKFKNIEIYQNILIMHKKKDRFKPNQNIKNSKIKK